MALLMTGRWRCSLQPTNITAGVPSHKVARSRQLYDEQYGPENFLISEYVKVTNTIANRACDKTETVAYIHLVEGERERGKLLGADAF
ncbi:hypothetical protein Trydic_g8696 [Trypoxylus dichotomus]